MKTIKKKEVLFVSKQIKQINEVSHIRHSSVISRNVGINTAKSKNSDDLLRNSINKNIPPALKFNTINVPSKLPKQIISSRIPEKIRTCINTPKSKNNKALEKDSNIKNITSVVDNSGDLNKTLTFFSEKMSLDSNLSN